MRKDIKIIIIGFGSIGRRHYGNLLGLGFKNVCVYDVDKTKTQDASRSLRKINLDQLRQFDVAVICNPNHLHVKTAIAAAKAECHLFIEKPLSHNLKGIKELIKVCREKKLINMVGCNMRFHPCLKFIKDYLSRNKLGRVYGVHHECGYWLPYWRPNHDYRKNYAAKKKTGGGIILDDIHEFDLLFWLNDFAAVLESKFIFDKVSGLEIETEDSSVAAFKFKNKVLGSVRCDYLQQAYSRECKVIGEKGNLKWDFKENIVWLETKEFGKSLFKIKNYDINNMYIDEVKYFFERLGKKQKTFNGIETAYNVLKHCVSAKRQALR